MTKENEFFCNAKFEHLLVSKIFSVKEFLAIAHGTLGTAQTVRWPCEPIILLIGHFRGPTKVQLNSW